MKQILAFILLCAMFPFFFAASAFAQTVTGAYDSFDGTGFGADTLIAHTWIFDFATGANVCGNSAAVTLSSGSWTSLSLNDFGADTVCSSVLSNGNYSAWTYTQYAGYAGESYCGGSNDYTTCSAYLSGFPSGYAATFDFEVSSGPPPPTPSSGTSTPLTTPEAIIWVGSILITMATIIIISSLILLS